MRRNDAKDSADLKPLCAAAEGAVAEINAQRLIRASCRVFPSEIWSGRDCVRVSLPYIYFFSGRTIDLELLPELEGGEPKVLASSSLRREEDLGDLRVRSAMAFLGDRIGAKFWDSRGGVFYQTVRPDRVCGIFLISFHRLMLAADGALEALLHGIAQERMARDQSAGEEGGRQ